MKKIFISSYSMHLGGVEKALINLLNNIDYDNYKVDLMFQEKEGELLKGINKNVNVMEYKKSKFKKVLLRKIHNMFSLIFFLIKNFHKYDASISYTTYDNVGARLSLIASKNSSLLVHVDYYQIYSDNIAKMKEFFSKVRNYKFKRIIFVSNESKNNYLKVYDTNQELVVINNLIDYENILNQAKEKVILPQGINLLFVGRLAEDQKAFSRIIALMENLKKKNDVYLTVVGSGPDMDKYQSDIKTKKIKNINFVGFSDNPYKYMKRADYIVLSSNYEGFPVIYNEAIVLNKQFITTVDVSDDIIESNKYFFIVDKDKFVEEASEIINNTKEIKYEKVDFKEKNAERVKQIINC